MRFGDQLSPRIYTWGNPGVPQTNAAANVIMGVARATEGGTFSRNYVPMHDASTTEAVVRQVRFPVDELEKTQFQSLAIETFTSGDHPRAVVAIDMAGRMWTWGTDCSGESLRDATGLGGPDARVLGVRAAMHRPIRVLMPSERDGTTVTWAKVQFRPRQPLAVAMTKDGKLYGSGSVPERYKLDQLFSTTSGPNTVTPHFIALSTQTWNDFALLGANLFAIRNDGTLHTKSPSVFGFNTVSSNQVKGILVDATFSVPCFLGTGTSSSLSYTLSTAPAGGVNARVRVVRNTSTGECRPYVEEIGHAYVSVPAATRFITPATATTPTLTLRLSNDTAWSKLESNGDRLLAFESKGTNGADVFMLFPTTNDLPDEGFYTKFGPGDVVESFNVAKPLRTDDRQQLDVARATAASIQWDVLRNSSTTPSDYALRLTVSHTNNSNIIAWGANRNGCLAVGHTNAQSTLALVQSPDTAEFFATDLSLGGDYSLAIRYGDNIPQSAGALSRHLYCAGKHEFSGNSAATASITTFTMCSPESVNKNHLNASGGGRNWHSVFAHTYSNTQFSVACRNYFLEGIGDDSLT
jgi:hypothetical protein